MENFSFFCRPPRRGDVVVFNGVESPMLGGTAAKGTCYDKRITGLPGEHLEIAGGELLIDGKETVVTNRYGRISFITPAYGMATYTNVVLGTNEYFVTGDNATNSLDSRYFGAIQRKNIKGRVWFCYWPPDRFGRVR